MKGHVTTEEAGEAAGCAAVIGWCVGAMMAMAYLTWAGVCGNVA